MKFFTATELSGKLPAALVHSFSEVEARYLARKKELEEVKQKGESSVDHFLIVAKQANDAFLEWKGANKAVARFLNINMA